MTEPQHCQQHVFMATVSSSALKFCVKIMLPRGSRSSSLLKVLFITFPFYFLALGLKITLYQGWPISGGFSMCIWFGYWCCSWIQASFTQALSIIAVFHNTVRHSRGWKNKATYMSYMKVWIYYLNLILKKFEKIM